jgi:hypothetical protein
MEIFAKLFERFLVFVYHCFDRIVIQGYMPLLTRPEHIVHFFRDVHGQYPITPQVLAKLSGVNYFYPSATTISPHQRQLQT